MNFSRFAGFALLSGSISLSAVAAPMPNSIVVDDKAVVPVLKTEVLRRVEGQKPIRHVEATILEFTNKGKDIVAKEVVFDDNLGQFSDKKLAIPVIQKGGVIVPTSKIELNTTVKQDGEIIKQTKTIDAEGMEFKKNQAEPVKRTLQLKQHSGVDQAKVTHTVMTENGETTRDLLTVEDAE
ncbi:hypothetical protein [Acinetobacter thermotolerans]|uniref:hypothetical protein n=1 Tax=Acinetobacter thermotolerans TaxID=3151487 RepID=UPI00325C03E2